MTDSTRDTPEACIGRINDAWNARDPDAYAAEFTEEASNVFFFGQLADGRTAIRDMHAIAFTVSPPEYRMALKVLSIRAESEDVSVAVTLAGVGADLPIPLDKIQTFVLVKRDARWKCAAFHNTAISEMKIPKKS